MRMFYFYSSVPNAEYFSPSQNGSLQFLFCGFCFAHPADDNGGSGDADHNY